MHIDNNLISKVLDNGEKSYKHNTNLYSFRVGYEQNLNDIYTIINQRGYSLSQNL